MKHVTQSINTSLQNRKSNQAGEKRIGPHPPPSLNKRPISTNKATINPQLCCSFKKLSKHPQRQPAEVIIIWLVSQYLLHLQRASSHVLCIWLHSYHWNSEATKINYSWRNFHYSLSSTKFRTSQSLILEASWFHNLVWEWGLQQIWTMQIYTYINMRCYICQIY
jgi:hypothetical protein